MLMRDSNKRIQSLDILRAIAVILVLGRHLPEYPEGLPEVVRLSLKAWGRCGWIGVDLFFVLSGFLVSGLLFREHARFGKVRVGRFLARRGFKIYPAFYVMLVTSLVVQLWQSGAISIGNFVSECLFLQSYFPGVWNHTWTLAVEEHFYIMLAVLIGFLISRKNHQGRPFASLPMIFLCVAVAALLLRCLTSFGSEYTHRTHKFPTHLRMDSLFFGVFLSYLYHFHPSSVQAVVRHFRIPILAVSLGLLSPALFFQLGKVAWLSSFGFTLLYLGFGGIVIAVVDWRPSLPSPLKFLGSLLAGIGFYSYSIYLWHIPVNEWGSNLVSTIGTGRLGYEAVVAMYLAGSVIVGVLMAKIIELPLLRVRDRFLPSRSQDELSMQAATGNRMIGSRLSIRDYVAARMLRNRV